MAWRCRTAVPCGYRRALAATSGWRATWQMQTLMTARVARRNADGSVWARFKAGKAESEAVSGNIDMDSNYPSSVLGGDILASGATASRALPLASWLLHQRRYDSTGNRGADGSQFTSSGNVDGYNLGVYATGLRRCPNA